MKEATRHYFIKPYVNQFIIMVLVVVPIVDGVLSTSLESKKTYFITFLLLSLATIALGTLLTMTIKYMFAKDIIEYFDAPNDAALTVRALRSASRMPLAEGLGIYFVWQVLTAIIIVGPMYAKGFAPLQEAVFMMDVYTMCALTSLTFFYLLSENSLSTFFEQAGTREMFEQGMSLTRLNLTKKVFIVILLIAIPPIGYLTGFIYLNIYNGLELKNILLSFALVIAQTFIMTFLNGYLLMKGLSRSVSDMSFMLKDMAKGQGDLTKRLHVTGVDEVGELASWFNEFIMNLDSLIGNIKDTTLKVSYAVGEVSIGAQGLSQTSQEQASAIEEVASTIEEMTSSIKHNAENASHGRQKANESVLMANQSGEISQQLITSMSEISAASRKIGDIITTVNEVAFQTNLLALNAAVEAARAGEHGKGFAVVAQEVRALAQRSADASKQIKTLIEDTVNKINDGDAMVKKSGESLEKIIHHIHDLSRTMEEIADASIEQATGVDEVNRAITQIDASTQLNASTSEELASTSDSLNIEAQDLAENVERFKVSSIEKKPEEASIKKAGMKTPPVNPASKKRELPKTRAISLEASDEFEEF